ncbi:hypothetical protein [Gallaecimonas xiamenensis]|uniref:Uncharacterized protein n=1 Tax=Gallaecimonas xiamenensis 3-C-1 TaxID=745411 RepID=K2JJ00_9GAMM|nr:hypothetical protein [Gallaecimonas xiamenensis]EKE75208.1 hypothetical protein B3C1_08026 [Gallaecimonas xiamenensis 3-C-1]
MPANSITKEQWASVQEELAGSFAMVAFQHGEVRVSINRARVSESRSALAVYLDGQICVSWGHPCVKDGYREDICRYWRRRSSAVYSPKEKARLIKAYGKRRVKQHFPNLDDAYVWWDCTFNTAQSLVTQFKKLDGLKVLAIGFAACQTLAGGEHGF